MNPMIAALQNSRSSAPNSADGPAGPSIPLKDEVDPTATNKVDLQTLSDKLDKILALLNKNDAEDANDDGTDGPQDGSDQ